MDGLEYNFPKERTRNSYVLRLIAVPSEVRLIRGAVKVQRHEIMGTVGINGCQGTTWSEKLGGKELHGALGGECDLEPRRSVVSCTSSTRSLSTFQPSTSVVLCWF